MDHYQAISALIDASFEEEIAFLQQLVRIPSQNPYMASTTPPDVSVEQQVAVCIYHQLRALGFSPAFHGVTKLWPNVLATVGGAKRTERTFILTTHMDTVPPSAGYTRDPFEAEIDDGKMYGRGWPTRKPRLPGLCTRFMRFSRRISVSGGNVTLAFVVDEEAGACSPYDTGYLLEQGLLQGDTALVVLSTCSPIKHSWSVSA